MRFSILLLLKILNKNQILLIFRPSLKISMFFLTKIFLQYQTREKQSNSFEIFLISAGLIHYLFLEKRVVKYYTLYMPAI